MINQLNQFNSQNKSANLSKQDIDQIQNKIRSSMQKLSELRPRADKVKADVAAIEKKIMDVGGPEYKKKKEAMMREREKREEVEKEEQKH